VGEAGPPISPVVVTSMVDTRDRKHRIAWIVSRRHHRALRPPERKVGAAAELHRDDDGPLC
jgi:hypothetical protein